MPRTRGENGALGIKFYGHGNVQALCKSCKHLLLIIFNIYTRPTEQNTEDSIVVLEEEARFFGLDVKLKVHLAAEGGGVGRRGGCWLPRNQGGTMIPRFMQVTVGNRDRLPSGGWSRGSGGVARGR